jgi:uncharacterized repeat protein (TIGR03809 family)
MAHQVDVAGSRDIVARWRDLAEQRLEYLTELFETGRWRRYHSELAFLENIQEAKNAVETWRDLSMREDSPYKSANYPPWLGRVWAPALRGEVPRDPFRLRLSEPAQPLPGPQPLDVSIVPEAEQFCSNEAPAAPELEASDLEAADLEGPELEGPDLEGSDLEASDLEASDFGASELQASVMATPLLNDSEMALDLVAAIVERYPQLRNVL